MRRREKGAFSSCFRICDNSNRRAKSSWSFPTTRGWEHRLENSRSYPRGLRGSGSVSRGKKGKTSRRKGERKTKRGQRRVYDVTQVTYEIIIGFRDFRANRCAAALARRWLAFHITFATLAARTRLFSTYTPSDQPFVSPPHLRAFSFIFPFVYRISTIARAVIFCLR